MGNINVICQNCGVGLEIEDDVTSFDCPNCGARLHTNFQEIEDTEIYYQDRVARNRSVQSQRKGHGSIVAIILAVILFAGVGVYLWFHPPIPPTPPTPSIAVRWPLKYKEAKKMSYKEESDHFLNNLKLLNSCAASVDLKLKFGFSSFILNKKNFFF